MPFGAWYELATAAEFLPAPPITRNQIDLMRHNNLASSHTPGANRSRHRADGYRTGGRNDRSTAINSPSSFPRRRAGERRFPGNLGRRIRQDFGRSSSRSRNGIWRRWRNPRRFAGRVFRRGRGRDGSGLGLSGTGIGLSGSGWLVALSQLRV